MTQYDDVYSDRGRGGPLQEQYEANLKLLADYQKDCTHPGEHVTADILEYHRRQTSCAANLQNSISIPCSQNLQMEATRRNEYMA